MKKVILTAAVLAIAFSGFKMVIDKASATAEAVNGVQVFAYSKPANKYDVLGMVKVKGLLSNEKGPHMVDLLVGYAKKDFPSGEGIILNSEFEKAEVIKFRE